MLRECRCRWSLGESADAIFLLIETDYVVHLGLNGCCNLTDQCIVNMVNQCSKLTSIDLDGCKKITDVGVSALGAGCGQLISINLVYCKKVTDAGISALRHVRIRR